MMFTQLRDSIPKSILNHIIQTSSMPTDIMLRKSGYKIVTSGDFKIVIIHQDHVIKFSRPHTHSTEKELEVYKSLSKEQRKIVIPVYRLTYGITITPRAHVFYDVWCPTRRVHVKQLQLMNDWEELAEMIDDVATDLHLDWNDVHKNNIGFLPDRAYPIIIDLDYLS